MGNKILAVVPSLARGGAERVVSLVCGEWAKQHDVTLALFNARDRAYALADAVRIVDLARPASASGVRKAINAVVRVRRLGALIRREAPDRIISFTETANFPAIIACLLAKRLPALTISVRNNPLTFPWFYRILIPFLYPLAGRVVTVSEGVRRALIQEFHLPKERCVTIPNPVDFEAIERGKGGASDVEAPDGPFIVAAGRLVRQKGFDMLLEAFNRCRVNSDHQLVILGDGPEREHLAARAEELGLERRVLLPGSAANPFPLMSGARCFVLSSRFEGWPNVITEAMACGCPVVAFDCPYGPSEIIEHGKSGVLVSARDVPALARAIDHVVTGEETGRDLARGGRERVRRFDSAAIAARWLQDG